MPDLIWREQIAAKIIALMQADFRRPGPDEMREVLKCAEGKIAGLKDLQRQGGGLPASEA